MNWQTTCQLDATTVARILAPKVCKSVFDLCDCPHSLLGCRVEVGSLDDYEDNQIDLDRAKEQQMIDESKLRRTWKLRDQSLWE